MSRIIVTTAPEIYDYESTVLDSKVIANGQRDRVYREVTLDDADAGYYADYQCSRYQSGLYPVYTIEQFEDLRTNYPNLL